MSGVMDGVDRRTQMVGQNRLELLLFDLGRRQKYGINVFKVREVIKCPVLTKVPNSNPLIRGIAHLRGATVTVMDLGLAIGQPPIEDMDNAFVVLTEFNRSVQGFLVQAVERIININWEEIHPPPAGSGKQNYMTAITRIEDQLVEILDVEQVLAEVVGTQADVAEALLGAGVNEGRESRVLVVDDSSVARKQITRTLEQLGIAFEVAKNGRDALDLLKSYAMDEDPTPVPERFGVVISDVEMPEMDGYTLTKSIKDDPDLAGLYVLLHTSLSGVFNSNMVKKVGADEFIPKFNADELAETVVRRLGLAEPEG